MAAKQSASKKTTKKAAAKKPAASRSRAAERPDKSVEEFREALERSVTLSRDRIQEIVDDAVKRGRMTRSDANDLVSKLVSRGRKQTEELLKELEKALDQARGRAQKATKRVRSRTGRARKRVTKAALDVADEPLAQADKLRSRAGGPGFPITAYDELTATQVKHRIPDLTKADARKVRTRENKGKARKSVLEALDKRLAS
jgi:polyhydroxyalkanoate synthesis regulator phasin